MVKTVAFTILSTTKSCVFLVLKMKKKSNLLFDDFALEYVSQHRHLGVLFSSNLNTFDHIYTIINKAYKKNLVYIKKN